MKKVVFIFAIITIYSCTNYGKKMVFDELTLYYTEEISESQARRFGSLLSGDNGYEFPGTIQLARPGETAYEIRFITTKDKFEKFYTNKSLESQRALTKKIQAFTSVCSSEIFDGETVMFIFCDMSLNELESFPMIKNN